MKKLLLFFCCSVFALCFAETSPLNESNLPIRNLMVTVKNNNNTSGNEDSTGISGGIRREKIYIGTGKPVQATDGVTIRSNGLAYSTHKSKHTTTSRTEQQLRTLEGRPAYIYTGQAIFVPAYDPQGNISNAPVEATRGFFITAHVTGSHVLLEISVNNDTYADNRRTGYPVINTEHLSTTTSGKLGEWIPLANLNLTQSNHEKTLVKKITTNSTTLGDISIRIQLAD